MHQQRIGRGVVAGWVNTLKRWRKNRELAAERLEAQQRRIADRDDSPNEEGYVKWQASHSTDSGCHEPEAVPGVLDKASAKWLSLPRWTRRTLVALWVVTLLLLGWWSLLLLSGTVYVAYAGLRKSRLLGIFAVVFVVAVILVVAGLGTAIFPISIVGGVFWLTVKFVRNQE